MSIYPTVLTGPPLAPSKLVSFLDFDASTVHFPHNDALIITMLSGNCRASKILVERGSSVNILYRGALDRMEDTPEAARAMINSQTQLISMGLMKMRLALGVSSHSQYARTPTTSSQNST